MKVLFINDSKSNTNWGDRAAATALKEMVRASGGDIIRAVKEEELWTSRFSEEPASRAAEGAPATAAGGSGLREIVRPWIPPAVLGARRRLLSRRDEPDPGQRIPARLEEFEVCAAAALREKRFGWPGLLRSIDIADVVVIHGASIDGPGVIPRTDLFLTYLAKRHFGRPVLIVNHTADLDDPELRLMAESVYPHFDDVVFRDPISAERCAALCSGRFAADSAFRFAPAARQAWATIAGRPTYFDIWPHEARFDPAQPYICVGGSSILWADWDPPKLARGFAAVIESVREAYSGQVVLTASDTPDQTVFEILAAEQGLPLVGVTTPVQQAVDILGNADAYIGGRWHPGIFALRGGAPVVALSSKTFKMRALVRAAGLPESTFDVLRLGGERAALVGLLQRHLEAGPELRQRLSAWAAQAAENSWDNVAYLRRWAPSGAAGGGDATGPGGSP